MSESTEPAASSGAAPIDGTGTSQSRPPASRLILIRHGESTWNRERRIQGQLDPPLSEQGYEQARRVAGRLAHRQVEALYTSDLLRASQTAAPIASALGVDARPMKELREIFLGDWEGIHTNELAQRFPEAWDAWTREPSWDVVPRGEGASAFEARVASALEHLFDAHTHGDAIVVTHGGVIQIALHSVVGRPSHGLFPFRISNGSVTIVERRNGRMVIATVNDTSHLEGTQQE
jgi:2,3-bisphosphoglycerate-dependent phosphoglycerate mutase